jgi:hypothetical protein
MGVYGERCSGRSGRMDFPPRRPPLECAQDGALSSPESVTNEMKGAYRPSTSIAGPSGLSVHLPGTPYEHESGGGPRPFLT